MTSSPWCAQRAIETLNAACGDGDGFETLKQVYVQRIQTIAVTAGSASTNEAEFLVAMTRFIDNVCHIALAFIDYVPIFLHCSSSLVSAGLKSRQASASHHCVCLCYYRTNALTWFPTKMSWCRRALASFHEQNLMPVLQICFLSIPSRRCSPNLLETFIQKRYTFVIVSGFPSLMHVFFRAITTASLPCWV